MGMLQHYHVFIQQLELM